MNILRSLNFIYKIYEERVKTKIYYNIISYIRVIILIDVVCPLHKCACH